MLPSGFEAVVVVVVVASNLVGRELVVVSVYGSALVTCVDIFDSRVC